MNEIPLVGGDLDIGDSVVVRVGESGGGDEILARNTCFEAVPVDLLAFLR